jgi:16S rRNA (guanine966-N2)-methyltransferase
VRISGGDARGIRLKTPKGVRPASEKVRQAIFASVARHIPDARVLDLFAGSGAYALEALSRGASSAVLVERDHATAVVARENARTTGFGEDSFVREAPVDRYLRKQAQSDGPFDVVFIDPPYDAEIEGLLDAVAPTLDADGIVVVEQRYRNEPPPQAGGLVVEADRRYGDTRVLMYRAGENG